LAEGAAKVARLSVRDYVDDLVTTVSTLDSAPLLVGHSLGGLLAQLVAARAAHAGLIAACPSSVGPSALNKTAFEMTMAHAVRPRPWAKPVYPPTWQRFWRGVGATQSEEVARAAFDDLVCESGRALFFELAMPWLDRAKTAKVDHNAIAGPVLIIAGAQDRIVPKRLARRTAAQYTNASYVEIPGSDHMVFYGHALPVTMDRVDDWIASNGVLSAKP
jgi:pimeloyl-ACP methyl ester carboxylesterase